MGVGMIRAAEILQVCHRVESCDVIRPGRKAPVVGLGQRGAGLAQQACVTHGASGQGTGGKGARGGHSYLKRALAM